MACATAGLLVVEVPVLWRNFGGDSPLLLYLELPPRLVWCIWPDVVSPQDPVWPKWAAMAYGSWLLVGGLVLGPLLYGFWRLALRKPRRH